LIEARGALLLLGVGELSVFSVADALELTARAIARAAGVSTNALAREQTDQFLERFDLIGQDRIFGSIRVNGCFQENSN
jgi:hypothetical protein